MLCMAHTIAVKNFETWNENEMINYYNFITISLTCAALSHSLSCLNVFGLFGQLLCVLGYSLSHNKFDRCMHVSYIGIRLMWRNFVMALFAHVWALLD
jgi:hypothetical protein